MVGASPSLTSSAAPSSTSSSDNSGSTGFWDNKGAVAGTFTAVAVVGAAILFFALTAFLRRRRAKKFDKEVEKAAAEAAMATAPRFEDDDDYPASTYPPSSKPYSDHSHGTLQQQPMPTEAYNMQDFNNYYNAGYDSPYAAAGVAGAGAGAGVAAGANRQSQYGAYDYDAAQYPADQYGGGGAQPYAAYAGPDYYQNQPGNTASAYGGYDQGYDQYPPSHSPTQAGYDPYGPGGAAAVSPAAAAPPPPATPSAAAPTSAPLMRHKSGARSLLDMDTVAAAPQPMPHNGESYAAHYEPGGGDRMSRADTELPNPFSTKVQYDDEDESDDEEDHQPPQKVLKVANQ